MKILVVCQHYWPEPFNTADVCEGLVARGHEVTCLTGLPNTGMAGNDIPLEWRDRSRWDEVCNGVRIVRAELHPRLTGAKARVKNYLSFWRNGNRLAKTLPSDFDVVLGYQFSPVMQVDPGLVYAKKNHTPMLLYSFDLWPVSLTAGGFSESSIPYRWIRSVSKRIYSQADRIAVTSPLFDEYFRDELGLCVADSSYLPQYADDAFSEPWRGDAPEGYDFDLCNLTFAGNVGQAQSVETIVEAARLLADERSICFHIVGSGSMLAKCQAAAEGLTNITFHGRHDVEEMPAYYAASDAMIVTFESSPMARYTLPRKVTTYLAAGRPILAAAEGETGRVVREAGCGLTCGTADAEGLARIAREFAVCGVGESMGKAARDYYGKNFTKDLFFDRLEGLLLAMTKEDK